MFKWKIQWNVNKRILNAHSVCIFLILIQTGEALATGLPGDAAPKPVTSYCGELIGVNYSL